MILECKRCVVALARNHGTYSDLYCIVCDKSLKNWDLEEVYILFNLFQNSYFLFLKKKKRLKKFQKIIKSL